MNIRLWVILICGLVVYNIYYETNIFKHFTTRGRIRSTVINLTA